MYFEILVFATALGMEGIGSYISIVGLNSVFAGNFVILAMSIILDVAKIVTISILYKYWTELGSLKRAYLTMAVLITMSITSWGAFGYLSSAFMKAAQPNKEITVQMDSLKAELQNLEKEKEDLTSRKKQIESQIANLPSESIKGRQRLIASFKPESERISSSISKIDDRIPAIRTEVAELEQKNLDTESHVGPIAYVAKEFGVSMDSAIKYVILILILVFDPLAVMLVICGNFLVERREIEKAKSIEENKHHEDVLVDLEKERIKLAEKIADLEMANLEDHTHHQVDEVEETQAIDPIVYPSPWNEAVAPVQKKRKRKPKIDEPKPKIASEEALIELVENDDLLKPESADVVTVQEESQESSQEAELELPDEQSQAIDESPKDEIPESPERIEIAKRLGLEPSIHHKSESDYDLKDSTKRLITYYSQQTP